MSITPETTRQTLTTLGNEIDICCQAACVKVPCPDEAAVNETTSCAGACTQGNGTEEETAAYASCQASCFSSFFLNTATDAAGATGSNTASGADATATGEETGIGDCILYVLSSEY